MDHRVRMICVANMMLACAVANPPGSITQLLFASVAVFMNCLVIFPGPKKKKEIAHGTA